MQVLTFVNWSEDWPFLLLAAVAVFFIATAPLVRGRKRRIARFAEVYGMTPMAKPEEGLEAFETLHRGNSQSFDLGFEAEVDGGIVLRIFEYSYFVHVPPASTGFMQTVVAFNRPGKDLATFRLVPLNAVTRVAVKLGAENIAPYESTVFSRRYRLQGEYPMAVHVVFRPELVQLLENVAEGDEPTVESAGEWIIFFYEGRLTEGRDLGQFVIAAGQWLNAFHGTTVFHPR